MHHRGFTLPAIPSGKLFILSIFQQEELNIYTYVCISLPLLILFRSPGISGFFTMRSGGWGWQSVAFPVPLGKSGPNREQRMAATQSMCYLSMMLPKGAVATLTLPYRCDYIKEKASTGAFLFHSSAAIIPLVTEHIKGILTHYLWLQFLKPFPGFPLLLSEHNPLLKVCAVEIN